MIIQTEYKGFTIQYVESKNEWIIVSDHATQHSAPSLMKLKEYIDKQNKKGFVKFDALLKTYKGYKRVTVTSIPEDGGYWVVDANKNRSKEKMLYVDNIFNRGSITLIEQLNEKMDKLRTEVNNATDAMETLE